MYILTQQGREGYITEQSMQWKYFYNGECSRKPKVDRGAVNFSTFALAESQGKRETKSPTKGKAQRWLTIRKTWQLNLHINSV